VKAADLFDVTRTRRVRHRGGQRAGACVQRVLAANGAHVVMTDIDPATLSVVSADVRHGGGSVETIVLDVEDTTALRAAIDGTTQRHGRLDAVFANAGISAGTGPFTEAGRIEEPDARPPGSTSSDVNLTSVFATIQAAATPMIASAADASSSPSFDRRDEVGAARRLRLRRDEGGAAQPRAACRDGARAATMCSSTRSHRARFGTNIANGRVKRDPVVAQAVSPRWFPWAGSPSRTRSKGSRSSSPRRRPSYVTGAVIPIDGGTTAR